MGKCGEINTIELHKIQYLLLWFHPLSRNSASMTYLYSLSMVLTAKTLQMLCSGLCWRQHSCQLRGPRNGWHPCCWEINEETWINPKRVGRWDLSRKRKTRMLDQLVLQCRYEKVIWWRQHDEETWSSRGNCVCGSVFGLRRILFCHRWNARRGRGTNHSLNLIKTRQKLHYFEAIRNWQREV